MKSLFQSFYVVSTNRDPPLFLRPKRWVTPDLENPTVDKERVAVTCSAVCLLELGTEGRPNGTATAAIKTVV